MVVNMNHCFDELLWWKSHYIYIHWVYISNVFCDWTPRTLLFYTSASIRIVSSWGKATCHIITKSSMVLQVNKTWSLFLNGSGSGGLKVQGLQLLKPHLMPCSFMWGWFWVQIFLRVCINFERGMATKSSEPFDELERHYKRI